VDRLTITNLHDQTVVISGFELMISLAYFSQFLVIAFVVINPVLNWLEGNSPKLSRAGDVPFI
jgi:hypothetical protein